MGNNCSAASFAQMELRAPSSHHGRHAIKQAFDNKRHPSSSTTTTITSQQHHVDQHKSLPPPHATNLFNSSSCSALSVPHGDPHQNESCTTIIQAASSPTNQDLSMMIIVDDEANMEALGYTNANITSGGSSPVFDSEGHLVSINYRTPHTLSYVYQWDEKKRRLTKQSIVDSSPSDSNSNYDIIQGNSWPIPHIDTTQPTIFNLPGQTLSTFPSQQQYHHHNDQTDSEDHLPLSLVAVREKLLDECLAKENFTDLLKCLLGDNEGHLLFTKYASIECSSENVVLYDEVLILHLKMVENDLVDETFSHITNPSPNDSKWRHYRNKRKWKKIKRELGRICETYFPENAQSLINTTNIGESCVNDCIKLIKKKEGDENTVRRKIVETIDVLEEETFRNMTDTFSRFALTPDLRGWYHRKLCNALRCRSKSGL